MDTGAKACIMCKEVKPIGAFNRNGKGGRDSKCYKCKYEGSKERRQSEEGKRKQAAYAKRWRDAHVGAATAYAKRWRESNPEYKQKYNKDKALRRAYLYVDELRDSYIAHLIRKESGCKDWSLTDMPKSLVDLKRNSIKLKRELKQLSK